ncbi:MAG: hypothetical protein JW894_13720 [Bacteroidales bacterium]|nr:hypothetical protein [Bacteroidales bacterium]
MIGKNPWFIFIILFFTSFNYTNSQQNRIGGSLLYNFSNKGFGLGLRAEFPVKQINLLEGISVVPQVAYYPSFNTIHEFYIGSSVNLNAYVYGRWTFYGLLNISYNGWINNENTEYRTGNFSNFELDLGLGVNRKLFKCLYPFLELRYSFIWNDPVLHLGMMYTLHCDRRGMVKCSKIPPQPEFFKQ